MKILFVCKRNETYGFVSSTRRSSGLYNSTSFIVRGLRAKGINAKLIEVVDNNSIDREVLSFRPDVVIIEALWVVPEKFPILQELHPRVKWFCHLHSHMPFLAMEGIAMQWLKAYVQEGVGLIANSIPAYMALLAVFDREDVRYLPNNYIPYQLNHSTRSSPIYVHIGCFGAVRPLKNQLLQAMAAIQFSKEIGKFLFFHINGTRTETDGDPVLKNLRNLFASSDDCSLVEHPWYDPNEFLECLEAMDIGMQVSLSETFNVVTADYVTAGIPVVCSNEISWISRFCWAKSDSLSDIVRIMHRVYKSSFFVWLNRRLLSAFSRKAQKAWFNFCIEQK